MVVCILIFIKCFLDSDLICDVVTTRYVGNVHPNVTESLLIEVFQGSGPVERCKLIRKEKVHFYTLMCNNSSSKIT